MGKETETESTFSSSMIEELANVGDSPKTTQESQEVEEIDETEVVGDEEGVDADESEDEDDTEAEEDEDSDEDEEDDEEDEEEDLGKSQTRLLKEMTKEILALRRELKAQKSETGESSETKPAASVTDKPIEFVDDTQFNNAMESKEEFNRVLNTVYQAGQTAMLSQLPSLIGKEALKQVNEYMLIQDFYKSNPDLRGVGPLVQTVAEEIVTEHKGKKIDTRKLLAETAKRTRERMGKTEKGKKIVDARPQSRNPGAIATGGARPGNGRPGKKRGPTVSDEILSMSDLR